MNTEKAFDVAFLIKMGVEKQIAAERALVFHPAAIRHAENDGKFFTERQDFFDF